MPTPTRITQPDLPEGRMSNDAILINTLADLHDVMVRMVRVLERWDGDGMPTTRSVVPEAPTRATATTASTKSK